LDNLEKIESFTIANVSVSYTEGPFVFSIWLNNITNEVYNTSGVVSDGVRYFRQAPRNFFASIAITL